MGILGGWLRQLRKTENSERVLIYCQIGKLCACRYQVFSNELSELVYSEKSFYPRKRPVYTLRSKIPATIKNTVLDSFS